MFRRFRPSQGSTALRLVSHAPSFSISPTRKMTSIMRSSLTMRRRLSERMPIRIACRSCNTACLNGLSLRRPMWPRFAEVWYRGKCDHSATDHRVMNAVLDAVVQHFQDCEEEEREEFRGQLKAYRNLYAFPVTDHPLSG